MIPLGVLLSGSAADSPFGLNGFRGDVEKVAVDVFLYLSDKFVGKYVFRVLVGHFLFSSLGTPGAA